MKKFVKETLSGTLLLMGLYTYLIWSQEFDQPIRFWVAVAGVVAALLGLDWRVRTVTNGAAK